MSEESQEVELSDNTEATAEQAAQPETTSEEGAQPEQATEIPSEQSDVDKLREEFEAKIDKMSHGYEKRIGKLTGKLRTQEEFTKQYQQQQQQQPELKREDFGENVDGYIDYSFNKKLDQFQENQNKDQQFKLQQQALADDWNQKLTDNGFTPDEYKKATASLDYTNPSKELNDILITSPKGPRIAEELAKNPERFEQLNQLSGAPLYMEMFRIESTLQAPEAPQQTKQPSRAPAPVAKNVGSSTKASVSMDDFIRQQDEADKKRGLY